MTSTISSGGGSVVVNDDGSETLAPVGLLTLGKIYYAAQNGLPVALAAAGSNGHIVVADAQAVTTVLKVPAGVTLEVKQGGLLTFGGAGAITFTAGSALLAGPYQIFAGTLSTVALGTGPCPAKYLEWWGGGTGATAAANDAALTSCLAAGGAAPLQLLGGTYHFAAGHTISGMHIRGTGAGQSIMRCDTALGAAVPFLALAGTRQNTSLRDLGVGGPGSYGLGVDNANCAGVRLDGNLLVERVCVQGFSRGIWLNNFGGHMTLRSCQVGHCYYGVYCGETNGGDDFIEDCDFTGNNFAGIVVDPLGCLGAMVLRTHMGYAPYGIYILAHTNQGGSIVGTRFYTCNFEACGNGAIYDESAGVGNGVVAANYWQEVGHSVDTGPYRLAGRAHDYAVVVNHIEGVNVFDHQVGGFAPYDKGTWYVGIQNSFQFVGYQRSPESVMLGGQPDDTAGGYSRVVVYGAGTRAIAGQASIPSGSTSLLVEAGVYCGPPASLGPALTLGGSGGLAAPGLVASNVVSAVAYPPVPPATATAGAAGNVPSGTRKYFVTYVTRHGETTAGPACTVVLSTPSQVVLSAIPTSGSPSVTKRNLYRLPEAGGGAQLVTIIADNTTSTATDDLADASLGAAIPTTNTSTGTRFTVTLTGGIPASAVPFSWRLR